MSTPDTVSSRPRRALIGAAIALALLAAGTAIYLTRISAGAVPATGSGPLVVGGTLGSGQLVTPGTTIGYGLAIVWSPDQRQFTITSARALTDKPDVDVQPAYGMPWPRGLAGVQFTAWPPTDPDLGGTPAPLPVTVAPNLGDPPPTTELFVAVTVPDGGLLIDGVEVTYTDGDNSWTTVVPHQVRYCTTGDRADCKP